MGMDKQHVEYDQSSASSSVIIKPDELLSESTTYPLGSSESSVTSYEDNGVLEFGPIKVKPRAKPAPTLASGRRSKYDVLSPEEEQKRDLRRARNRAAAERVRVHRLQVEQQLQNEIDVLEQEEQTLSTNVDMLQRQKLRLTTRLATREQMSSMAGSIPLDTLMSPYVPSSASVSISSQVVEQLSEHNVEDLFSSLLPSLQSQQEAYVNSSTVVALNQELDDFFQDS